MGILARPCLHLEIDGDFYQSLIFRIAISGFLGNVHHSWPIVNISWCHYFGVFDTPLPLKHPVAEMCDRYPKLYPISIKSLDFVTLLGCLFWNML